MNQPKIEKFPRYASKSAGFAENLNRSIKKTPKKSVFQNGDASRLDDLYIETKKENNAPHSTNELKPDIASLKKNENELSENPTCKRKKVKLKYEMNALDRTADKGKVFSEGDILIRSYKIYRKTEVINTIPSFRINI